MLDDVSDSGSVLKPKDDLPVSNITRICFTASASPDLR